MESDIDPHFAFKMWCCTGIFVSALAAYFLALWLRPSWFPPKDAPRSGSVEGNIPKSDESEVEAA